jgi:hypothetical protein
MITELKEIKPGYGLGAIKFGMTRTEVASLLGQPDDVDNYSYTDSDTELTECWEYLELELSMNFDADEDWRLVMLSVTSDFYSLNGKKLIGLNKEQLIAQLNDLKLGEISIEDFSSEESPNNIMIEIDNISFNVWLEDDIADEIQWSPLFIDDDTIKWPE